MVQQDRSRANAEQKGAPDRIAGPTIEVRRRARRMLSACDALESMTHLYGLGAGAPSPMWSTVYNLEEEKNQCGANSKKPQPEWRQT